MKIRLAYKLFLTILVTCLISIVFMAGIMRYFVRKDFEDFVNRVEMERLGELVEKLGTAYQEHRDWGFLKGDPEAFREILHPDLKAFDREVRPPDSHGPGKAFEPAADLNIGHPPPRPHLPIIERRISLFDVNEQVIAGRATSPRDHIMKAITVDGRTVGWLGLRKRKELTHPLEEGFLYRQTRTFFIIGLSLLILSALVAYLLSRHLLKPVAQLAQGAHALASRRFDTRVSVRSGDELGQLADDFNTMAQTLERFESLRKQWITDISHELRTPLAILRGEIEAMQDGVRDMTGNNLESLHAEVMHLQKLVADLHELSMMDSGELSAEHVPVDVISVLKGTMDLFAPRFSQSSLAIGRANPWDGSIMIAADRDRLAQVFSNILENSLRYTESPGEVKVWWEMAGESVHINFEDSKPGVSGDSLDKLFDRLYRIDPSRSRRNGGSGLGLAICRGIVEALGGQIKAGHSSLGGLRIEIVLPVLKRP